MRKTFTDAKSRSLKKKLHSKPSALLPDLAHELIDQLSVISFCRVKIGETFAGDPNKPTKDFEELEDAIQEVGRLIKEITNALSNSSCSQRLVMLHPKPVSNSLRIIK